MCYMCLYHTDYFVSFVCIERCNTLEIADVEYHHRRIHNYKIEIGRIFEMENEIGNWESA